MPSTPAFADSCLRIRGMVSGRGVAATMGEEIALALYRQGDVLLVGVEGFQIPRGMGALAREHGRNVLAHGEATGHAHAIADEQAALVSPSAEELYLLVYGKQAILAHDEHDPISVPRGVYRVIRQREYDPTAWARSRDVWD